MEKRGLDTGLRAINPLSGEEIPVWVANYVLMDYGSGAIMAVPAHDQRDWEFARKYALPIRPVIAAEDGANIDLSQAAATVKGTLINSAEFDGLTSEAAFAAIAARLEQAGRGQVTTNYRLRDWGVSRQRYWGTPIPFIHCEKCGVVPAPKDSLPITLPEDVDFRTPGNPLLRHPTWKHVDCPTCGGKAERETDTLDTFVDSSWYFLRFASQPADKPFDRDEIAKWLPVEQYIGGIEHAILHLLYARFFHKLMRDEGLVSSSEPFERLLCQGMVLAESFYREGPGGSRIWVAPTDVDVERDERGRVLRAVERQSGDEVLSGGVTKMSKSKNNGIDPHSAVETFGADTVRLFTMFAAPPEQTLEWHDAGVEGASRFLRKLWKQVHAHLEAGESADLASATLRDAERQLRRKAHETIAKVSDDYGRRQTFNTAVAAIMELCNDIARLDQSEPAARAVVREALQAVVLMLSPIVPHICHHLWPLLGGNGPLLDAPWPQVDESALVRDSIDMAVQVNGKVRAQIAVAADADKATVEATAMAQDNVQRFLDGVTVRKVIVVPGKLVNIVAN